MIFIAALALICFYGIFYGISDIFYRKSSYYKVTHNSLLSVWFDKGRHGEYLTYKYLRNLEKDGARFLFNVYLPKDNGETTEIDVLLIHNDGIFVFESKNYSGWIFGGETQKNWTQCLPKGKGKASQKEHFLNPIFQNKLHISTLKQIIGENFPCYSIIVFSERCTLKNISVSNPMIRVINRNQVSATVKSFSSANTSKLSQTDVGSIYNTLFPFTQVSAETKEKHISAIQNNHPEKGPDTHPSEGAASLVPDPMKNDEAAQASSDPGLTCPLCGGALVMRTATRGENKGKQFYGCSNYPKCRYVKNI